MKATKRAISLLLLLAMVLSMVPTAVAAGTLPFTDVSMADWFYKPVEYVYENGLMSGTGATTFSPNGTTTRGMIVTILHRLEGQPAASGEHFADVAERAYYADAVAWASDSGIVAGYGNARFGPDDPITRQQLATILLRYADYCGKNTTPRATLYEFYDAASVASYAVDAMQWAVAEDLIKGSGGYLNPNGYATRAQVATILERFCDNGSDSLLLDFIFNRDDEDEDDGDDNDFYTVTFESNGGSEVEPQDVEKGEYATMPEFPEREDHVFVGWYVDSCFSELFDFWETAITEDITLYARWIDTTDDTDTDGDGLANCLEEYFETDKTKVDTDSDGLSDYVELITLGLDPLKRDTDDNGTNDGDEDNDLDGLSNLEEVRKGTNPALADTDMDGLDDKEEAAYGTDPLKEDTDEDGVSDGKEVELGTDPLSAQTAFDLNVSSEEEDTVTASVEIELSGEQVETLSVDAYDNDTFFPETMPGYMGKAYDFNVEGSFDRAVIRFEFDPAMLEEGADPTIYYFNEEEQELEELPTTINGNVASAEVTHFSKYILVDRTIYEDSFTWVDVWDSEHSFTDVEVVFVIDDSGSMTSNDQDNKRLDVARTLIDNLPAHSKIGLVRFDNGYPKTEALTPTLTTDRDAVKDLLTETYFTSYGGTDMYNGINKAFPLFEATEDTTLKMMIVLSDGDTSDTNLHSSVIATANNNDVRIYTVGLGSDTYYFNRYLNPLATNTGAKFYLASNANELADIYKDISEKIDLEADSDVDGIPDYYEDNMIIFSGVSLALDKNNPDTDGDGIPDGEEVIITIGPEIDGKVKVTGKMIKGDPTKPDTDGDGFVDKEDNEPFKWNVSARDLAILSQAVYCRSIPLDTPLDELDDTITNEIDQGFHRTATIKEMQGWEMVHYYRATQDVSEDELYGGLCYAVFTDGDNTVLAFRGSQGDMKKSVKAGRGDWYRNYLVYPFVNDPDGQSAENFGKKVLSQTSLAKNCEFYVTGHSRGGMLAQRAGVGIVEAQKQQYLTNLVYFNGMGVVFTRASKEAKQMYDAVETIADNVIFMSITGDIVSGLGCHVALPYKYNKDSCSVKNHNSTPEHFLCNFTAQLPPSERNK